MSILNITNLTDEPEGWILDKFEDAFGELEKELNITIDETEKRDFIDAQIDNLIERMEEAKGSELLGTKTKNNPMHITYLKHMKKWLASYKGKAVGVGENPTEAIINAYEAITK